jgi:HlyD family secretion protein
MKTRSWLILLSFAALFGAAGWRLLRVEEKPVSFRLEAVKRQDVRSTVTATGTLQALVSVEVGTQVSGVVDELLVDFNDPVEAGQVIARIDATLLRSDVASAQAALAVRRAEAARAAQAEARAARLVGAGAGPEEELETARASRAVADAQVQAAQVQLDRAERTAGYATITAPVSGTVIERAVEVGQTVNAGMTAPRLFVIAGDLSKMEILASVDEADIGRIQVGQDVMFTVQAWPDDRFRGRVRQVRLQPVEQENVITYGAVIDVDNAERRLVPGMTASVDFIVAEAKDVLCVAHAAARFRPDPTLVLGELPGRPERGQGVLWQVGEGQKLTPLLVAVGLKDQSCTEVSGEGVAEGLEVVAGVLGGAEAAPRSPLQGGSPSGQRPGGF